MAKPTEQHIVKQIIELYLAKESMSNIAKKFSLHRSGVRSILKREDVPIEKRTSRVYFYNENLFSKIITKEQAYFLGFLYADGNVCKNSITLALKDGDSERDILTKYVDFIGTNKINKCEFWQNDSKGEKVLRKKLVVSITCKKIADDLRNLGCFSKKSFILKFPNEEQVPKRLIHHFMRGYFDGDGCVGKYLNGTNIFSLVGTLDFISGYRKILSNIIGSDDYGIIKPLRSRSAGIFELKYSHSLIIPKIRDFLYPAGTTLFLKRKGDIMFDITEKEFRNDRIKLEPLILNEINENEFFSAVKFRNKYKTARHTTERAFRKLLKDGKIKLIEEVDHEKIYSLE